MVPSTPVSPSSLGVLTCPITRSISLLRFTYYLSISNMPNNQGSPGARGDSPSNDMDDSSCMCHCM
jgi:hypothetical protein